MKSYYYILFLAFNVIFSIGSRSQTHCSTILNTTIPTINTWDWRTQVWQTNIYSTLSGQVNSVISPFHAIVGGNLDNGSNKNIFSFVQSADKDNKPEDGWELIAVNLGISGQTPIGNAYAVFYNKYTAKLRAFFLVTQLFSDTGNNDATKGGTVKIYFYKEPDPSQAYQSNLLSSYTSPLLPLDQFKRDANIITTNAFRSTLPYWLYADFPVAYDPCTCGKRASITIECSLINTGNVDIKINSLPYQSPVQSNAVNQSTDFLQGFSAFANQAEGGVKAAVSAGEAISKLNDAIIKQSEPQKSNLASNLSTLNNSINNKGNWTDLIPLAGGAVNSVISLIDYFVSGGKSTPGPSPVMIMNDFKATGTIESAFPKNAATFYLPGSDQTGRDVALAPNYNNILGVLNLLYTPKVTLKEKNTTMSSTSACGSASWNKNELFFTLDENLKFVLNPALNIDLSKSDIKASYVIENCDAFASYNMQVELTKNNLPVYRSSYYPIGSLSEGTPYIRYEYPTSCVIIGGQPTWSYGIESNKCPTPKVFIKIVAKLRRANSTTASEDVYFIAKYPVNLNKVSTTQSISGGLENVAEDINLPDNSSIHDGSSFTALNTISIGSTTIGPSPNPVFFTAGEAIILREGGAITRLHSLKVGGIYSPSAPSLQSLQATSADLSAFCGGTAYNGLNNQRNVSARQAEPEEVQVLTKEEFFTFFPNPATDQVTFKYFIEKSSQVRLSVVDLSGKPIGLLVDEYKEMGDYVYNFATSDLPNGMYIIKFESDKLSRTEKLVVIK